MQPAQTLLLGAVPLDVATCSLDVSTVQLSETCLALTQQDGTTWGFCIVDFEGLWSVVNLQDRRREGNYLVAAAGSALHRGTRDGVHQEHI